MRINAIGVYDSYTNMIHMIYASVNTKGGVGKTMTAVHLSVHLSHGGPTLLIDGDPQGTAASWAVWRREAGYQPSPTTTILKGKSIVQEGKKLVEGFKNTVIDAGGRDSEGLRAALLLAQVAIVPCVTSQFDAIAMSDLMEVAEMARDFNPNLDVRVLLNRVDQRTVRDNEEMVEYIQSQGLKVLSTRVIERVAYRRAVKEGGVVHEYGRDQAAIADMDAFFAEVAMQ